MTKRIFRSIFVVAFSVFVASLLLILSVVFKYLFEGRRDELRLQTELCSAGFAVSGEEYLQSIDTSELRITHVSATGEVLYDSEQNAEALENHIKREEIAEALSSGYGESSRHSETEAQMCFYSAKRLPDGSVLRLSVTQKSAWALMFEVLQLMCAIMVIALVMALVLASGLSKKIVSPLNSLNLDDPLSNKEYDELSPLLSRIDSQQKKLKKQSARLRRAKDEFATVTSNMNEGLVLINTDGVILSLNKAAGRLLFDDEESIAEDLTAVSGMLGINSLIASALSGKREERIIELSGREYEFDLSPVMSEGEVSGAVLLIFDVTEKAKSEQLRREFTANVSHELKTPLHSISGYAELLTGGMVKSEDTAAFSAKIYTEAQRMIRLVDDIIKLSSLDEGEAGPNSEPCDLYALAQAALTALEAVAEERGVALSLEGESTVISGVAQQLSAVIYNLCDNAIKYNRSGGSVRVRVEDAADNAELTVEDTGIGIPAEHSARIFERFYRVDKSHSKAVGGTGLGLSIVKHAVRLHDGEIKLSSSEGIGTTVKVILPHGRG